MSAANTGRLDRDGGEPLYVQVRDELRQQIRGQTLPPGSALPPELQLMETYGVSRSVVRQALGQLASEGLITRHRGRGSVVAPSREHHRLMTQAGGLEQQLTRAGTTVRTELIDITAERAPETAVDVLRTEDAWRLERVRYVDESPLVFMRTWISRELFPDLTAEALGSGSLLEYMRGCGFDPVGGPRRLQAAPADATVAELLQIATGAPVIVMRAVTLDSHDRALEWATVWHEPSTVFDADAHVAPDDSGRSRARELISELAKLVDDGRI